MYMGEIITIKLRVRGGEKKKSSILKLYLGGGVSFSDITPGKEKAERP